MAKKKVCVSFDYENDVRYKNLLAAWDANPDFDFVFNDKTPNEIQSNDFSRIKAVLTQKINSATYLLVIIGRYANTRHKDYIKIEDANWQNWEINKARELKKKIIGIKLDKGYDSPYAILNCGATFVYGFDQKLILNALKNS